MAPRRNPHAVALGRKGGSANTAAQAEARARNGRNGGRPRAYRIKSGRVERLSGGEWIAVDPLDEPAKAWLRRRRAAKAAAA